MANLNTGSAQAAHALRGADLYETPDVAVTALLRTEKLPHKLWEPACGPGAIVRVLRAAGHDVVGTDLHEYGTEEQDAAGVNFLTDLPGQGIASGRAIITNPPFMHAQAFVERALELAPTAYMLLRLAFLESSRRSAILDNGQLARVHVFKERLPMMHRAGWDGPKVSAGAMPFAWFVFSRHHFGPATLNRISWRGQEPA